MTEATPRLNLPFLQANQAQKEIWHNEALSIVDALLHPVVEAVGVNTPPSAPAEGHCWIIGDAATGAWAGQGGRIACRSVGGWRFIDAQPGMAAWSVADGLWAYRLEDDWVVGELPVARIVVDGVPVVGTRGSAIANPAGGASVDVQARSAIGAILAALRNHGLIAT